MVDIESFVFQTPLYSPVNVVGNYVLRANLAGFLQINIDGHCANCSDRSTFRGPGSSQVFDVIDEKHQAALDRIKGFRELIIHCARSYSHEIRIWYKLEGGTLLKVGQLPSLADIANDEAKTYRSILAREDAADLHKAIGLAAHGVGVGSFVYLRRVFERLIDKRFDEFKDSEGWKGGDFNSLRMDEKVKFLKGHIPDFLYENRQMYSILSLGIHELSEEDCLAAFEPLKLSLKIILEEDKKKKEELDLKRKAAAAIKGFKLSK